MIDFGLQFKNLPYDEYFDGDPDIMKAKLWAQLEEVMRDHMGIDEGSAMDTYDFKIVDINFANRDVKHMDTCHSIYEIKKKITLEKRRKSN